MSNLRKKSEYLFGSLTTISQKCTQARPLEPVDAEIYLESINKLESLYDDLVNQIIEYNSEQPDTKLHVSEAFFDQFQDLAFSAKKICKKVLDKKKNDTATTPRGLNPTSTLRLPKLELPTFAGAISEWSAFLAQFDATVHKHTSYTPIEKLIVLRSVLKNEPLNIVTSYELVADSYEPAYNSLKKRYNNPRLLASHYLTQMLTYKASSSNDKKQYSKFLEIHRAATSGIKKQVTDLADYLLFDISYRNLPLSQQKEFDHDFEGDDLPTLKNLFEHVEVLARSEELHAVSAIEKQEKPKQKTLMGNMSKSFKSHRSGIKPCPFCKESHPLYRCNKFNSQPISEKKKLIQQYGNCVTCLSWHKDSCRSTYACRTCKSTQHHSFLCDQQSNSAAAESSRREVEANDSTNFQSDSPVLACQSRQSKAILLVTLVVHIADAWGTPHEVRAVLDPGSELNIITSSLVNKLGIRRIPASVDIQGVSQKTTKPSGAVKLQLLSRNHSSFKYRCTAVVLPSICGDLPTSQVIKELPVSLQGVQLADPEFFVKRPIDLLLGVEAYADILSTDEPTIIPGSPTAFRTVFGYVLGGRTDSASVDASRVSLFVQSEPIDSLLRKFWEVEEVTSVSTSSYEDELCETHFQSTHSRQPDGRYVVRLPFKPNAVSIGSNQQKARACLQRMEYRFSKNTELGQAYSEVLEDYMRQGHMSLANQKTQYFLPHHCVMKDSTSTRVRVVFDASATDDKGISLNDRLLSGPKLHNDLGQIITTFRFHEVALNADIRQMFRQIVLHPDDRQFQHLLWRQSPQLPIQEYSLNTVTFGVTSSPYLAQRTLHQLAKDEAAEFPHVIEAILRHCFMDDFVTGAQSLEAARQLQKDLSNVLSKGGFELRKWSSSHPEVLFGLPDDHKEAPIHFTQDVHGVKILGLLWDQTSDSFRYQALPFADASVTKRTILSYTARIWDCLGLVAAVTVKAKSFIQKLWLEKVDWDDPVPSHVEQAWWNFTSEMPRLAEIQIPRKISIQNCVLRLVGFSDASETAMAANVYAHVTHPGGQVNCHLLKAKTKLAPLKTMTIPRLELCAAVLLANLVASLRGAIPTVESVTLFSDSQIVLSWLRIEPHKLKIFIANRTIQILEKVPDAYWTFTPGVDNPADMGSRGVQPSELIANSLWWNGPEFLLQPPSEWPRFTSENAPEVQELKKPVVLSVSAETDRAESPLLITFSKFSSLTKLQHVVAYIRRFLNNARKSNVKTTGPLSTEELAGARQCIVRLYQHSDFAADIKAIHSKKDVSPKLLKLTPFLDSTQLLRAGGRLRRATSLSEEAKHPLVLTKTCHLSRLICDYYHLQLLHAGPRTTQAAIQEKYWILSLHQLLRSRIRQCNRCFRLSGQPQQPFMADLPISRVQESRAFAHSATDFAGPFFVKETTRRKSPVHKTYMCAFVCMAVKAVHLEAVTELSTAAFLAAFHRFVARRGLPREVFSDNGKNYVGAERVLREAHKFLLDNSSTIVSTAAEMGVKWNFQPPYAPNFNGLVEAVVKSTKRLLTRQIGEDILTLEEFNTVIIRIEAVLNSRPLVMQSSDPSEAGFLSPGHFLVGTSLLTPAEEPVENCTVRERWSRVQRISQQFWKQWSREYLHTLLQRQKWNKTGENIQIGQLVYMMGTNTPPLQWPLGRVIQLHPGSDSIVRVATVRCASGDFRRPVNKLLCFPSED